MSLRPRGVGHPFPDAAVDKEIRGIDVGGDPGPLTLHPLHRSGAFAWSSHEPDEGGFIGPNGYQFGYGEVVPVVPVVPGYAYGYAPAYGYYVAP